MNENKMFQTGRQELPTQTRQGEGPGKRRVQEGLENRKIAENIQGDQLTDSRDTPQQHKGAPSHKHGRVEDVGLLEP